MLKKISGNIPAYIKLLLKLYAINLAVFFCIRLLFYNINKSSDVGIVPFAEKLMAFRMGLEFDTAVFCWIAFLPTIIWSIGYFFKQNALYIFGFYSFLILQLIYHFVVR